MPDNTAVAELNDDEDSFFGCTFPLEWDPAIGFFPQSSTLKAQASSNIKNLLLTQRGERVGQPTFGSDLSAIIFNPVDESTGEAIELTIREALAEWLPYITAENVVTLFDHDTHAIVVQLEFRVDMDDPDALENLTLTFEPGG